MRGIIKKIFKIIGSLFNNELLEKLSKIETNVQYGLIEKIKSNKKYDNPKCLIRYGWKAYSQNDEDGIIFEIFNRIGYTNKIFVEFGVGDGLENNTLSLLFQGWTGLWIEGDDKNYRKIRNGFVKHINDNKLRIEKHFITKININEIIASNIKENEIDLLSIDIDGNDIYIFEAIKVISPRLVVIEYNGRFPPPIRYCMKYNETHFWDGSDNFGSSLNYMEDIFKSKGYSLVGCNITGTNAFFVKTDLVKDLFLEPYSSLVHYEPFRLSLVKNVQSHKPSYKSLENLKIL
jgi:hypothetical protein